MGPGGPVPSPAARRLSLGGQKIPGAMHGERDSRWWIATSAWRWPPKTLGVARVKSQPSVAGGFPVSPVVPGCFSLCPRAGLPQAAGTSRSFLEVVSGQAGFVPRWFPLDVAIGGLSAATERGATRGTAAARLF